MKQKGFTLIELLVVISVIGLIASVILVALNSSRAKARDAKRKGDLSQLQKALEFYYNSNNTYPPLFSGPGSTYCSSLASAPANFLSPYITTLPKDPGSGNTPYEYCQHWVNSAYDSQSYAIFTALETSSGNADTVNVWNAASGYLYTSAYNYVLANFTPP